MTDTSSSATRALGRVPQKGNTSNPKSSYPLCTHPSCLKNSGADRLEDIHKILGGVADNSRASQVSDTVDATGSFEGLAPCALQALDRGRNPFPTTRAARRQQLHKFIQAGFSAPSFLKVVLNRLHLFRMRKAALLWLLPLDLREHVESLGTSQIEVQVGGHPLVLLDRVDLEVLEQV